MLLDRMEKRGERFVEYALNAVESLFKAAVFVLVILWMASIHHNSLEAHRHAHEAIEACTGKALFGADGVRLEEAE